MLEPLLTGKGTFLPVLHRFRHRLKGAISQLIQIRLTDLISGSNCGGGFLALQEIQNCLVLLLIGKHVLAH